MARLRQKLTYANVVSTLCLFLVLGGVSYAALGRNSVGSREIKNDSIKARDVGSNAVNSAELAEGSVNSAEIAAGAVNSAEIAGGAVNSARIENDSVTGADIAEGTLQGISASAVGGLEVKKVNFRVPDGTPPTTILVYPGIFRIDAQCQNFGDQLDVAASTGVNGAAISLTSMSSYFADDTDNFGSIGANQDEQFNTNESFAVDNPLPDFGASSHATIHFETQAGFVAVTKLQLREFTSGGCLISGFSMGG